MTQTGKCDTCRQRKVKCDEEKPKCGACRKKDRPCTYTYGKASAFVVQDPNSLTKHGKSKITPVVYALSSSGDSNSSPSSTQPGLRVSTQRKAEFGCGTFQTLAAISVAKVRSSKKAAVHRRRLLCNYLRDLQLEASLALIRPSSAGSTLIARWVDMLGSSPAGNRPLSILGTWIQSIPSRIGSNPLLDLAVEFLIDSHTVYWDDSYSNRQVASATKSKALRELQLAISQVQTSNTYEMVLATKMHYAAETLLGVDTMYHAIHAFGLAELLKSGRVADVDDEHYWNLIDNTYIDDVNEAMLAGRASVYDNAYYLSATYPPAFTRDLIQLTAIQRSSMSIMHVFVQCPRLNCLVRQAIVHRNDSDSLAAAITLAEYMWQIDLPSHVAELMQTAVTTINAPPSFDVADILTETLHFDSVQSMILCTRYWMLQNVLCGLTDTLQRHFPTETSMSRLPDPEFVRQFDSDAGLRLAESLFWAESVSRKLPLVPLRLHTPLQISIGPWHRTIRNITSLYESDPTFDVEMSQQTTVDLNRAFRMRKWLVDECNRIHEQWDVSTVDENSLYEALDSMAGEQIPDWLPTRVRFENEDGHMVIKLDYEKPAGVYEADLSHNGSEAYSPGPGLQRVDNDYSSPDSHRSVDTECDTNTFSGPASIETESPEVTLPAQLGPANFFFESGRNVCSISGWWPKSEPYKLFTYAEVDRTFGPCTASSWWPQTPKSSIALLDSTHKASAFQPKAELSKMKRVVAFNNRKTNGCLSPAWSSTSRSTASPTPSDGEEGAKRHPLPQWSGGV